jgi:hypothetical protein
MELRNCNENLSSDPSLKNIEMTSENESVKFKYELLEPDAGRFGSMKIFLTCSQGWFRRTVTVHITDDRPKNAGI